MIGRVMTFDELNESYKNLDEARRQSVLATGRTLFLVLVAGTLIRVAENSSWISRSVASTDWTVVTWAGAIMTALAILLLIAIPFAELGLRRSLVAELASVPVETLGSELRIARGFWFLRLRDELRRRGREGDARALELAESFPKRPVTEREIERRNVLDD